MSKGLRMLIASTGDPIRRLFYKLLRQRSLSWPLRFKVSRWRSGTVRCQAEGRSLPALEVFSRHQGDFALGGDPHAAAFPGH